MDKNHLNGHFIARINVLYRKTHFDLVKTIIFHLDFSELNKKK